MRACEISWTSVENRALSGINFDSAKVSLDTITSRQLYFLLEFEEALGRVRVNVHSWFRSISSPSRYQLVLLLFFFSMTSSVGGSNLLTVFFSFLLQSTMNLTKRIDEVRLLESRKSARLADQDTDFARLADMAGDRKRTSTHNIDVPHING